MRAQLSISKTLTSPADAVWRVISDGTRVERWFEFVEQTVLKNADEGGVRTIHMKDGSSFEEYISLNDSRTRTYQYYAPDPPLPVKHVIGTKRLEVSPTGETVLTWFVTLDVTPAAPANILTMMGDLYRNAANKIDELARSA